MKFLLVAALTAVLSGGFFVAEAQEITCFVYVPRAEMVENLASRHNEHQVGVGVLADTHAMQLFLSDEGSWTVIVVDTAGMACLVLAGEGWQFTPEEKLSH